jgi:crotonobetainyl-CoA:carnitine CoA-transferase CaiB-like acyl-CoA transferase
VPSGEILGLEAALRQPQIQHRGCLQKVEVPGIGPIEVFGLTALFDKTSGDVEAPPPTLGQHNAEILGRLGYDEAGLAELKSRGAI